MAPSETIPGAGTSDESESPELAWIRDRLARPGKTQRGLATALGLDPSAVSRLLTGQRQLRAAELPVVSAYLEIDTPPPFLATQAQHPVSDSGQTHPAPPPHWAGARDLPVMGTVVAGSNGMFLMNGQVHDYIDLPPSLQGVAAAYAA
jgi:hypothetical protein